MIKIIVDAMGGDNAPGEIVKGAVEAMEQDKEIFIIFTGIQAQVEEELKKYAYDASRVEIVNCTEVIDMNDVPTEAIKKKKDSSLVQGFWRLKKDDDVAALVTAGSTGATIVGGQLIVGRIRGVKRAALCPAIPNINVGKTLLCDCGANAECRPEMLCQFAVMASAYAKALGVKDPKVGLLNNGVEEHKGDPLRQQTYQLMKKMNTIHFAGNIEAREINIGNVDVAVCDGFSGNIALKSLEGMGKLVLATLKKELTSSVSSKIGCLFMAGALKRMKKTLDFDVYGGSLLVGLKKIVIKSHGSSKSKAICPSILQAVNIYRTNLTGKIEESLAEVDWENLIPNDAL